MAKKTSKKAAAATKAKKKAPAKKVEPVAFTPDPIEEKAFKLAQSSAKVRKDLELAVTLAMASAARKVFKQHSVNLTPPQANRMAMVLFG
jgi:hypothetical protein